MTIRRALGLVLWCAGVASAQQVPDSSFAPRVAHPEFAQGTGPVILVDSAHNNVHTASGQYLAFARLARADGYRVQSFAGAAMPSEQTSIVAIVSPRNAQTLRSRKRPIVNAYSAVECAAVAAWVSAGGSLLLVADHMPIMGSMQCLFEAFGLKGIDGFATTIGDTTARVPIVFRRSDGTLRSHRVTDGRNASERVDSIATFTGATFSNQPGPSTLWWMPTDAVVIVPDEPWMFPPSAERVPGSGLAQGAAIEFGKGRVVVSAEAAMFTAQWEGAERSAMGMNHSAAAQNAQFVLNVLHWLSRR